MNFGAPERIAVASPLRITPSRERLNGQPNIAGTSIRLFQNASNYHQADDKAQGSRRLCWIFFRNIREHCGNIRLLKFSRRGYEQSQRKCWKRRTPKKFLSYDGEISKRSVPWEVAGAEISRDLWGKSSDASGKAAGGHLKDSCELAMWRIAEPPPREKSDSHTLLVSLHVPSSVGSESRQTNDYS